ncbi:MAG: Cys-tRNA(Pro) deacylase [Syntrophomonas sp.]
MANIKTNAIRILENKNVAYNIITYDNTDGKIDGISVAHKINREPGVVFKTLVTQGNSRNIYVFVIPVIDELDLKKAAQAAAEKKIDMIPVKDILKWTGYIRGGCSPVGMKKTYKTFIDASAQDLEKIIVSAGKIGIQVELNVSDLAAVIAASFYDLRK